MRWYDAPCILHIEHMKTISIIIATFNAGKVLQRCLDSLRPQKTEAIELLIIDGGSKDDTVRIIRDNADLVDYYVSEPDKGIYDAWNKGVKASTGEWIQFIGADDQLLPDAFSTYLSYLERHDTTNVDIISGKAKMVSKEGKVLGLMGKPFVAGEFKRRMVFSHGSTLHSRAFMQRNGQFGLEFRICGDYEFFMRDCDNIRSLFIDHPFLLFQNDGASNQVSAVKEGYLIRKKYHSISDVENMYILIRGTIGLYYRKLTCKLKVCNKR